MQNWGSLALAGAGWHATSVEPPLLVLKVVDRVSQRERDRTLDTQTTNLQNDMRLARSLYVNTPTSVVIVAADCPCPTRSLVRPTPSNKGRSTWRISERWSGTFEPERRFVVRVPGVRATARSSAVQPRPTICVVYPSCRGMEGTDRYVVVAKPKGPQSLIVRRSHQINQ